MAKGLRFTQPEVDAHNQRIKRWPDILHTRGKAADQVYRRMMMIAPPKESKLEIRFAQQLETDGFPVHLRNYFFLPDRDFELDFAWPRFKIGVSVEGMAHRVKGRFKADIEKHALGLLAGWQILRVGGDEVRSGAALKWLAALLKASGNLERTSPP